MSFKDTNPKDSIGSKKVPLSLLSPVAKAVWAVAQFCGATKYGAWNWRKAGVRMTVYLDAIDRHRDGLLSGEWCDPVDGTPHLGNIMACCAILVDAKAAGKLIDDRPPSVEMRTTYAEVEATMAKLREQYKDNTPRHYTIKDTELPAPFVNYPLTVNPFIDIKFHDNTPEPGPDSIVGYLTSDIHDNDEEHEKP